MTGISGRSSDGQVQGSSSMVMPRSKEEIHGVMSMEMGTTMDW